MRYAANYHRRSVAAHTVIRRCRRCEEHYPTADGDPDNLCPRCCHDKDFEQRVAAWFVTNPFAAFEIYSIFDDERVRVMLNGGRDWVEFPRPHPVYMEALRRNEVLTNKGVA